MAIQSATFIKSCATLSGCPEGSLPEYAFIGRSNVGKSTLVNLLTNRRKLAKTSERPGKTQLINYFLINDSWHLVDLPGYGYAKAPKKMREQFEKMIESYVLRREALTCLFVLIDSRHEPQKPDLEYLRFLGKHAIPFAIVFTKVDKLSASQLQKNITNYKKTLLEEWEALPEIFLTSALKRTGQDEINIYIEKINRSLK